LIASRAARRPPPPPPPPCSSRTKTNKIWAYGAGAAGRHPASAATASGQYIYRGSTASPAARAVGARPTPPPSSCLPAHSHFTPAASAPTPRVQGKQASAVVNTTGFLFGCLVSRNLRLRATCSSLDGIIGLDLVMRRMFPPLLSFLIGC
jgi:hypothetical protein